MNQASLLFLAEHLANDGDISRARRFMEFSRACNLTFCPQMRAYQVNPVINIIEKSNESAQSRANLIIMIAVGVVVLLLIALLTVFVIRKKQK
jgi:hypothetical protein